MKAILVIFVVGAYLREAACHPDAERHAAADESNLGIIGGHSIHIEQAPYMASLRILNGTVHACGACIIHEKFLLSAAHCCEPGEDYTVIVGIDKVDGSNGTEINVKKINPYPEFNLEAYNNDYCVIELEEPVVLSSKVAVIDLQESDEELPKETKFNATGWGYSDGWVKPEQLQQVELPLVDTQKCQDIYKEHFNVTITPQMICAGSKGHISCHGDSGGPLTRRDGDRNVLVGVTSWGACEEPAVVYARVSAVIEWIKEKLNSD